MTLTQTDKFQKVYDRMYEENFWDEVYVNVAEDEEGTTYMIFDSVSDTDKFADFVRETLEIEDERFWLDDELGVEIVYSDEYTTCSDCGNVIRTSPDSYHWQPDFFVGDGFIACNKCFNETEDYQEAYIEEKINNPKSAINGLITEEQLQALGFERVGEEFESGWYHREDDPEAIYNELSNHYDEVVFLINNVEQFRINFITYVRGEIEED